MSDTQHWKELAACAGETAMFDWLADHPRSDNYHIMERRALTLCTTCPVMDECADHALTIESALGVKSVHGVVGGMTAEQRRTIIRHQPKETSA